MSAGKKSLGQALVQRPFVACVAVLLGSIVFAGPVARKMRVVLRKDPVPLRRVLGELDKSALGGYQFVGARIIDPALLGALGTEEYIDWHFTDTTVVKRRDPLRHVRCFITYYTGKPDLVPHVADVCYLGQGYQPEAAENIELAIRNENGEPIQVPVRAITFVKSSVFERATPTVVYTFHCNGKFLETRRRVRLHLADPRHRGAYYCKVEVTFGIRQSKPLNATRQETITAAERFLGRLLPVLLRDHLPNWDEVQGAGQPT